MHHREQLRRERQAEYQAFLSKRQASTATNTEIPTTGSHHDISLSRPSISLAEKRRALASNRHQELLSGHSQETQRQYHYTTPTEARARREKREVDNHRNVWPTADAEGVYGSKEHGTEVSRRSREDQHLEENKYDYEREQRIEEERRYRRRYGRNLYPSQKVEQRGMWDEGNREGVALRQVRFERESGDDVERILQEPRGGRNTRKQWDEEEEGLMQWARGQGKSGGSDTKMSRAPTPPSYSTSRRNAERGGNRSLSAPVIAGGIAALGAGDTDSAKRRKKKEYAEQLRAQMREKQAAKEREREWLLSDTTSVSTYGKPDDSQRSPLANHSALSRQHAGTDEYMSSKKRDYPRGHERIHFSPERRGDDARHDHTKNGSPHNTHYGSADKPGNPPVPPYWPGVYYGGFPYPPPPNFPLPPPNGLPFYPPLSSLPPTLSNPYLAAYYHPPPAGGFESESKRGLVKTKQDRDGLKDHFSPQRVNTRGEEELNFSLLSSGGSGGAEKISKDAYRAQLMEQIREKHESKQRDRLEKSEFERRKEQEVYDPFGKGGCGAPLRDKRGQLVTDLKRMKKVNDERMISGLPSTTPLPGEVAGGGAAGILDTSLTEHTSPRSSYDVRKSKEFHKKIAQEGYKEVLKQQMREKEELKRQEKEKNDEAEKLEAERIQKELEMLEGKYKHEKEQEREKQHELKMKNEAMKREKEEKERMELERKREEEWQMQQTLRLEAEQKKQTLIDNMERQLPPQNQVRSNSPPIPTLRKLNTQFSSPATVPSQPQLQQRSSSPPVPTIQHKLLISNSEPQDKHSFSSAHDAATQPPIQQHPRTSSPIVPALRNKLATDTTSRQPPQVTRSFSAHATLPQTQANIGGDGVSTLCPSRSAHQLPQPSQTPIPTLTFDPTVPALPAVHTHVPLPAEDKMEGMLKNLRNMRRMLESERQKVVVQKHPDPAPTAVTADGDSVEPTAHSRTVANSSNLRDGSKPGFMKPRLAGPRKSANATGNPSSGNTQQQSEHRQRKQWQTTSNKSGEIPPEPQPSQISHDIHATMQDHTQFSGFAGNSSMFYTSDAMKHNPPPVWLRPGVPRNPNFGGHHGPPHTNLHNYRAPSVGGQSQFSIATLDVDSMARRNEERMQRLESILNTQARDTRSPQSVISDFLTRNSRARDARQSKGMHHTSPTKPPITTTGTHDSFYSTQRMTGCANDHNSVSSPARSSRLLLGSHELDCETGHQPIASTPT